MKLILGQRKVQVIGGSFLITLPKPWITTHEMKQGDPVLVELQSDDSLRISCILPSQSKTRGTAFRETI